METTHGKNGEGEYVGSTNHKTPTQAASKRTSEQRHAQRQSFSFSFRSMTEYSTYI